MNGLSSLFRPKAVAVVGASKDPAKLGNVVLRNIQNCGYPGRILPVNPREAEVGGLPAYASPADLPVVPEMAVVSVPAPSVVRTVEDCARAGIKYLVVVTAGFKETGAAGLAREEALRDTCRAFGVRLVGPNCLGVMDAHTPLNATFTMDFPPPGRIAFISQSGAMGGGLLDWSSRYGAGFSRFVSLGNKADLNEADFIEEAARDEETGVILCYIEDVADGRRFVEAARAASRRKPVVILKGGASQAGSRAASSHTGALSGSDVAYSLALRHCGVIRASSMAELFELGMVFATRPVPAGDRIAVVTNSGGPGIVTADTVEREGLAMAHFDPGTIATLRGFVPQEGNLYNPVDVLGDAGPERFRRTMEAVLADANVDALVVMSVPTAGITTEGATPAELARHVAACAAHHPAKPVVSAFIGGPRMDGGVEVLHEKGIPGFVFPESGVRALKGLCTYRAVLAKSGMDDEVAVTGVDTRAVDDILSAAAREHRSVLLGSEAARVAGAYGIATAPTGLAAGPGEAVALADQMGYPVVLKVASPQILHKTDVGGVITGLAGAPAVREAYAALMDNVLAHFPESAVYGVEVQKMMPPGVELLVGLSRDATFGHLVAFGLGGVFVDLVKDVSFRLVHGLTWGEIREMIGETRAHTLLTGYRGKEPADLPAVVDTIARVTALVRDFPQIVEMDINPLVAYPQNLAALDVKITMDSGGETAQSPPR